MDFKDLFSVQASEYARYRPSYPRALFNYLEHTAPAHRVAWDVGTGNGQAALELAKRFDRVVATDPSEKQIAAAVRHPKIEYQIGPAEKSSLADRSVDLITVAQAFHWFKHEEFYREVKRVAHEDALLAIWCYAVAQVSPEVDHAIDKLYTDILGPYWEKERKLVEQGYAGVQVPFTELQVPGFSMSLEWTADDMLGYLGTWSSLQSYFKKNKKDPRQEIEAALRAAWGPGIRTVSWPLGLRVFRI
jgi:SAM-dependent methyltransferase